MKISASIYSTKGRALEEMIHVLNQSGVDWVHVDCLDDLGVEEVIAMIRAHTSLPVDLHIISKEPEKFYPMIQQYGVDFVTLQYEDLEGNIPQLPDLGCEWGLAITTETPPSVFADFQDQCQFILFMTTVPGRSGGVFQQENFRKIREFRRDFAGVRVHVDGGVNAEVSFVLRNLGVFASVSGSYLVNADNVQSALKNLVYPKASQHLLVREVMAQLDELPVLPIRDLALEPLLQQIDDFKLGCCLLVDENGKLAGLSTNADLRRGFLKHIHRLSDLKVEDLVNPTPRSVRGDLTISEMLDEVKRIPFLVQFLPVVSEDGKLEGAINFNNLILGEL